MYVWFISLSKSPEFPEVELKLDSHANMFGVSDGSDALQDDRLKNDHLIGVTLPR